MSTVIKIENLGKQYRLGTVGTGSLAHDLNRTWHRLRGRQDPYLKIGGENDRSVKGSSDYVWALKEVSFGVKHGEVLGIIGRNGAGKSTLLKILSRTTAPTTGTVKIKGRVASLLEVGTGFHPELSGRENIFLNGAILGMTRAEIRRKFDEIVAFAGVERYIDTPVKRYSSGMYVRLAFAVAAHLEPEILIVDEVLAVGDAEFQKKALGKMKEVSGKEGRTVLFVSHNLEAVLNLCSKSLMLKDGRLLHLGPTHIVIDRYLAADISTEKIINLTPSIRSGELNRNIQISKISMKQEGGMPWKISYRETLRFIIEVEVRKRVEFFELGLALSTVSDFEIASSLSTDDKVFENMSPGKYRLLYSFIGLHLLPNTYKVGIGIRSAHGMEDYIQSATYFEVLPSIHSAADKATTRSGLFVPSVEVTIDSSTS